MIIQNIPTKKFFRNMLKGNEYYYVAKYDTDPEVMSLMRLRSYVEGIVEVNLDDPDFPPALKERYSNRLTFHIRDEDIKIILLWMEENVYRVV